MGILTFIIKNAKLTMAAIIALLLVFGLFMIKQNRALKEDNGRLSNNQVALTKDIEYYKTKSGNNAARVNELELTVDEFKNTCADQEKIIKDLGIKVKRLESVSSTGMNTNITVITQLHDTIYITKRDSIFIKENGKYFSWNDNWNHINGKIIGNNIECQYNGVDTITIAAHRVPKKFLFFRWGTKYVEVDITNRNTSSKITYNKTIKLKK